MIMVNGTCVSGALFSLMLDSFTGAGQVGSGTRVAMPLSNKVMSDELKEALKIAKKALSKYADCAALFGLTGANGNSSPDPLTVLSNIESSFNNFASIPSRTDSTGNLVVTSATTRGIGGFHSIPIGNGATMQVFNGVQITINNVAGSF